MTKLKRPCLAFRISSSAVLIPFGSSNPGRAAEVLVRWLRVARLWAPMLPRSIFMDVLLFHLSAKLAFRGARIGVARLRLIRSCRSGFTSGASLVSWPGRSA